MTQIPINIQFRDIGLREHLMPRVSARRSAGAVARRDLHRYYQLLRLALPNLAGYFSPAERDFLVRALRHAEPVDGAWSVDRWIDEAVQIYQLDTLAGVDAASVKRRLAALAPIEQVALLDAVERYWSQSGDSIGDPIELFAAA